MERNVFSSVLEEELAKASADADLVTVVSGAFRKAGLEYAKTLPIWMRCNILARQLEGLSNEEINWDMVNEILSYQNKRLDFNDFEKVSSLEEFDKVRFRAITAEVPEFNEPYYRKVCKTCGETFTLTRGELNYFQKKNLHIPGRCYACRKDITKPKIVPKTEEIVLKTQMQIALEKAGVC